MSAAASFVRVVLRAASREGVDPSSLLAHVGIDATALEHRDARVPTQSYLELFALAIERTGDSALGLTAARSIDGAAFGLLGFVVASCATLREALERFVRYSRLLCDELRVDLVERGEVLAVVYAMEATPQVPAFFEMAMTHLVLTARRGTQRSFAPLRVVFQHRAEPRGLPELVHAPVEFGGAENAVLCGARALDRPLRGANPALLELLEAHAALVLGALPPEDDLVGRTRHAIRALLPAGEPSLETVGRRLGVGARTLQRRLRERELTFRALVDDVRRECALAQLAAPQVSIAEVAFSLGFSGPSAFHHAFRRWTGRSPGERA